MNIQDHLICDFQCLIIFRTNLEELNSSTVLATFIQIKGVMENRKKVETAFAGENILTLQWLTSQRTEGYAARNNS